MAANQDFKDLLQELNESVVKYLVVGAYGGQEISILSRNDLIKAKRVSGRAQDKLDIEALTSRK